MVKSNDSNSKVCVVAVTVFWMIVAASASSFHDEIDITFGSERAKILNHGQDLSLSLDQYSASGFQSKHEYLFGRFEMQLKLVPGDSAGTVTTFYLSSQGARHDEIDFEFLGNSTGNPYTPTFIRKGREIKDNSSTYGSTLLHPFTLTPSSGTLKESYNIPVRVLNNYDAAGVPFPKSQPMRVYASLWNADDWATQCGCVKTDWTKAPYAAFYRKFNASANKSGPNSKSTSSENENQAWSTQGLDAAGSNRIRWAQNNYMIYNYCNDRKRFPNGLPVECSRSRFL